MIAYTTTASTTTNLKAVLAATKTTNDLQVTVMFHDVLRQIRPDDNPLQTGPQYSLLTTINVEVEICAAPATGVNRFIDSIHINNNDTVAATVTVFLDDGTNRILVKKTLQVGQSLIYSVAGGWQIV